MNYVTSQVSFLLFFLLRDCSLCIFSGHYVYIETSSTSENDTALLITQSYTGNSGKIRCLQFWYHMYGAHVKTLSVHIKPYGQKMSPAIWQKSGNRGDKWRYAQVRINANSTYKVSYYKLRFKVH